MQISTGKIVSQELVESLSDEDKKDYVPLTQSQAKKYRKLSPSERMGQYRRDMDKHKAKQVAKRRAANKRNKQSRKEK